MKKLFLSVCLLSIAAFYGYSQSLSLSNSHGILAPNSTIFQAGSPDSVKLVTYLDVKNAGSSRIDVLCKKVELNLLDSTEVTFCWAGECGSAAIYVSRNAQSINPGQTITDFSGDYLANTSSYYFHSGESRVRWVFFDKSNPNDSASVTVVYTTFGVGMQDPKTSEGMLSNIYPNPANGQANFSYSLPSGSAGTIIIRDLLGSLVQTQILTVATGKTSLNTSLLGDGVYFCSLLVDGKVSQTKKLIVRH
ncbi:MAG: T9SS type A sorting domain-containing protein [Bacteroidetes bacterium]|nr:T9SS type A sorting domain-containing protein [Bacteroidota bacterium]